MPAHIAVNKSSADGTLSVVGAPAPHLDGGQNSRPAATQPKTRIGPPRPIHELCLVSLAMLHFVSIISRALPLRWDRLHGRDRCARCKVRDAECPQKSCAVAA
jgi:hypothetical protein